MMHDDWIEPRRGGMRTSVRLLLEDLQRTYAWPDDPWLEHAYTEPNYTWSHEMVLTIPPQVARPVLVLLHRIDCGCDALTDELVLHG